MEEERQREGDKTWLPVGPDWPAYDPVGSRSNVCLAECHVLLTTYVYGFRLALMTVHVTRHRRVGLLPAQPQVPDIVPVQRPVRNPVGIVRADLPLDQSHQSRPVKVEAPQPVPDPH